MTARWRGLAAVATGIALLTAAARLTGFARVVVFDAQVGAGCTGAAYAAANQLPNVLFEVAAGGALAGAVVPVLAGRLAAGRADDADRTASALLFWVVALLVPVAGLLAALAGPLSRWLLAGSATAADCGDPAALADLTARMIVVFAPQVVLYGVGVVLAGVLQARHRFTGPALAPLLSSLVVIGAYLLFGGLGGGPGGDPARLPGRGAELALTAGTTLGVAVLSLSLLRPVARAGVRLRPGPRFPPGALPALRGPALAGLTALLAQQGAVAVTVVLASRVGGAGALNALQFVQAVYLLPYAVLAVPLATAAFPRLAAHAAAGRRPQVAATVAAGTRGALVVGLLGTAVLAAVAPAVQDLFRALDDAGGGALGRLGESLAWFAVGLPGWALVAHHTRVLYALGRSRAAASATAAGWGVAAAGSLALTLALRAAGLPGLRATLVGTAVATSAGMLLAAALLWPSVRRAAGPDALAGTRPVAVTAVLGALAGGVAGQVACRLAGAGTGTGTARGALGTGLLAAVVALAGYAAVAWWREPGPEPVPGEPRVLLVQATSDGGTGRHVAALAGRLAAAGVPVRVAGPADAAHLARAAPGVPLVPLAIADRPRPGAAVRAVLRLRALAGEVDVVHAHGLRAGALAVLAARSRRARPRVLVTVHNALAGPADGRRLATLLARGVARGADRVLAVSGDVAEELRGLGARWVERALVPAPPRPAAAAPAEVRAALGIGPGALLLVTVARLAPQKGLDVLLDVADLLRARPVRLAVAGDGPLAGELAARAARDVLPVLLLGRRDDVADLLAAADVVVVPSRWEGQSLVVQEALRAGAAVVATDAGGTREVAGDGAVLVRPGDAVALAEAVAALLDDPAAMIALRQRARLRAAQLPTDDHAAWQVLAIYRALRGDAPHAGAAPSGSEPPGAADTLEARGAADS